MNNFIGRSEGAYGVTGRYHVDDNVSIGLTGERSRRRLTRFAHPGKGRIDGERAIADVRYTFGDQSRRLRPFVEGGVGRTRETAQFMVAPRPEDHGARTRIPKTTDRNFVHHVGAGVTARLAANVELDARVAHTMSDNLRYPTCLTLPGQQERCDLPNTEGRLWRTTGYAREYRGDLALRILF